jgi:hypothetical protein
MRRRRALVLLDDPLGPWNATRGWAQDLRRGQSTYEIPALNRDIEVKGVGVDEAARPMLDQ